MIYENGYPHILYVFDFACYPIIKPFVYVCFTFSVCSDSLNWEKVKGKVQIDVLGLFRLNEESMHRLVG